ncbi:MAG: phosphosulfolactate synthase [Alicyclobacillaceae bacterium]|nr:phosphosulfolactate synthase [Alicyclobacillaceae bacterium]
MESLPWSAWFAADYPNRAAKPRHSGVTAVADDGIPLSITRDILQNYAAFIDYWKFDQGTAIVLSPNQLQTKVALCKEYDVKAYPSGMLFELALLRQEADEYLQALKDAGIGILEITSRLHPWTVAERHQALRGALEKGFEVHTESYISLIEGASVQMDPLIREDLMQGAQYVHLYFDAADGASWDDNWACSRRIETVIEVSEHLYPLSTRLSWPLARPMDVSSYRHRSSQTLMASLNLHSVPALSLAAVEAARRGLWQSVGKGRFEESFYCRSDALADVSRGDVPSSSAPSSSVRPKLWFPGSGQPHTAR